MKKCTNKGIVHVRITGHRPATNGIAERFVERLKEMLAERLESANRSFYLGAQGLDG